MLYIFDVDNTLIKGLPASNGRTRPANTPSEQVLFDGVLDKIVSLKTAGHKIALARNMGGVAWGFIDIDQADKLMIDVADKLGCVDGWAFCPHDERAAGKPGCNPGYAISCDCRKPKPGMLISLCGRFNQIDTMFVGDQDSDRDAARAAGIWFAWASDFFERASHE